MNPFVPLLAAILGCEADEPSQPPAPPPKITSPGTSETEEEEEYTSCPENCCEFDFECPETLISAIDVDGLTVPVDATVTALVDLDGHGVYCALADYSIAVGDVIGATTLAADGASVTFVPDAPFAAGTEYEVLAYVDVFCSTGMCFWGCDDARFATFTTEPAVDPALVVGRTYVLPWSALTLTTPTDAVAFAEILPIHDLLLQVRAVDPTTGAVDVVVATGSGVPPVPDCATVVPIGADLSGNPHLEVDGDALVLGDGAWPALLEALHLEGRFAADGSALTGLQVEALLPTEQLVDGSPCDSAVAALGGTCEPCSSSSSGQCLRIEGATASAFSDAALDPVATCGL